MVFNKKIRENYVITNRLESGIGGGFYSYLMMRNQFDVFQGERRERREKEQHPKKFTECIRDTFKKIEDVIVVNNSRFVDVDILIEILSDSQQEGKQTLELYAIKEIRKSKGKEIDFETLLELIQAQIQKLSLKDNVERWIASFKNADKSNSNAFHPKKLKQYMQNTEYKAKLTQQQEKSFKDREIWTYNELSQACMSPK